MQFTWLGTAEKRGGFGKGAVGQQAITFVLEWGFGVCSFLKFVLTLKIALQILEVYNFMFFSSTSWSCGAKNSGNANNHYCKTQSPDGPSFFQFILVDKAF